MTITAVRALQQQAASAFFAAVMTVAMLASIGVLASPASSDVALLAATHLQAVGPRT